MNVPDNREYKPYYKQMEEKKEWRDACLIEQCGNKCN